MLLTLLGACVVVGPFWGPEWEPVHSLLPQDRSCRDPRCCGNLLVLCLFLIWQFQHFWHQVTRFCSSKKNVSKMPLQARIGESQRGTACFRLTPEFFSPSRFRDLDAHVLHLTQNPRWRNQRCLQEGWVECLLGPRHLCEDPPWSVCSLSELILGTSSFSSTCLLPQSSSWAACHMPWCPRDDQLHCALHMWQRTEQLMVHSHDMLAPLEQTVSRRAGPASNALPISLLDLPVAQRLQACHREPLPGPANLQLEVLSWKASVSSRETWTPQSETQTVAREHSRKTEAPRWGDQREGREVQVYGGQFPTDSGVEDRAEAKALGRQRLIIRETEEEILLPEWEKQMGVENRARVEEPGRKTQRVAGGKSPPETQAPSGEKQAQLRCTSHVETQTPEWGSQDKNRNRGDLQTQALNGKNQTEGGEEEEGAVQSLALEKQGRPEGDSGEEALPPEQEKQNQMRGNTAAETEAKGRRRKGHGGGEEGVQAQASGEENMEVGQQDDVDSQAWEWEKQAHIRKAKVTEIQTPVGEKQGQGESERARNTEAHGRWKWSKRTTPVGWEDQGRGQEAGEPRVSGKKQCREIREQDWVVIRAPWWGNQRLVVSELNRELKMPCQGNQNRAGDENRAEIQATKEIGLRGGGDEDGTNTRSPEAENKGQFRGDSDVEIHLAGRRNKEWFGDGNGREVKALGKRNQGGTQGEDGAEIREAAEGSQGQLDKEFQGQSTSLKWKDQGCSRGKDGADIQTPETENWGESTGQIGGETQSIGWKKSGQAEYEGEIQVGNSGGVRGEDGSGAGASREGSQRQAGRDMDRKSASSEWENQEQKRSEDGPEIQILEKRKQRVPEGEDTSETQGPERENRGPLECEIGGCCSSGTGSRERTPLSPGGESMAENQLSKDRSQKEAGSECSRRIQRLTSKKRRLLKSKVDGKSCLSAWKHQEQTGGRNGAEIQLQGKRNLRGTPGDHGRETQVLMNGGQAQPRGQTDGDTQTQWLRYQNMGGTEDVAEIWGVGSQRKSRPEDATVSQAARSRDEGQVRGKDGGRGKLQGDSCGAERPSGRKRSPAQPTPLAGFGCWAWDLAQTAAAINGRALAPCSEMGPRPRWAGGFLMAGGEGEHVARQSTVPASKPSMEISSASQQPQHGSLRRRQRDKRVDPAKAASLTWQPGNLQAPDEPSACSSLLGGTAGTLAGAPSVPPKWPDLKKSRRLLLESLMRRRIAHLTWGLPRRILESYLLFSFFGSCSMPRATVKLPGLCIGQELQREQVEQGGAQGFTLGLKSPKKPPSVVLSERKSSTLPTQARAMEKHRPHPSAPVSISTPPPKPRKIRPPGGARERQLQEAVPKAELAAPGNPSPTESRSWCGPESVRESSSGSTRGRTVIRPGVSEGVERAPSKARTLPSRVGHNHWNECTSWEVSEAPRLKNQQPTYWKRGSPEPVPLGRPVQQRPSCSPDTSSFKGSLFSAAARLSETQLSKRSSRSSASNLSLQGPSLLPSQGGLCSGEACGRVSPALDTDLQLSGLRWPGVALPRTGSPQGQGASPNPPRWRFMKHLQCFFFRCGIKK